MNSDSRNQVAWLEVDCGYERHRIRYDGKHLLLLGHTDQTFAQFMRTWNLLGRPDSCGCAYFAFRFQEALRHEYPDHHLSMGRYIRSYTAAWYTTGLLIENARLRKKWRRDLVRVGGVDPLINRAAVYQDKLRRRRLERMQVVLQTWRRGLGDYMEGVVPDWGGEPPVSITLKARRNSANHFRFLHIGINGDLWGQETYGWPRMMDCDNNLILGKRVDDKGLNYKLLACLPVIDRWDPWRVVFRRRVFVEDPDTGGMRGDWAPIHKILPINAHQKYVEVYP